MILRSNNKKTKKLFSIEDIPSEKDILCQEAIKILDYDFDSYDSWKKWKYKSLLNENLEGDVWFIDPIWVQQGIKIYLMKKAYKSFHQFPFTANVLVSWFFTCLYQIISLFKSKDLSIRECICENVCVLILLILFITACLLIFYSSDLRENLKDTHKNLTKIRTSNSRTLKSELQDICDFEE